MPPLLITPAHAPVAPSAAIARSSRRYVYRVSAVVALGGLLFGFDLSIISGTVQFFSRHFRLDAYGTGWAVGCINIGSALGALLAGYLSDRLGRRKLLLGCALLFAGAGVGTGWASSFAAFIMFRGLSGVAVGTAALVCPMYLAEIAMPALRGRLVACYQLAITLGILLAYVANYLLLDTGPNNWRWMFASQAVPALLFFGGLFMVAESPRWLVRRGRRAEALAVLTRLGGAAYAEAEVASIAHSFAHETREHIRDLWPRSMRYILLLGVAIAVFSQADGQNSLFSYAPEIFRQAGMRQDTAFLQSIILGLINFVFTFVAIGTVDRVGRRQLLLVGAALLSADAAALAAAFYLHLPGGWVLGFVLGFIAIYAATLGPVTWVVLAEVFPNRVRGNAMAAATLMLWLANFFTTASFPILQMHVGLPGTFACHAAICLLYFLLVKAQVPETRGKSLEQIELQLTTSAAPCPTQNRA